jgi:uncharacterized membrane protein YfcA
MPVINYVFAAFAAIAAGFINAMAGGGTLITFPVLITLGLPAVSANVTNTVALLPGYLGGTMAQSGDLKGQKKRLLLLIPAGAIGGLIGAILLIRTGEKLFTQLVPFLILLASILLAIQGPVRRWLTRLQNADNVQLNREPWAFFPTLLAAIYGGYFGAGLSVILLAVMGLLISDTLTRLNASKQVIAFSANAAAALFFIFSGRVDWGIALVMAIGALLGGSLGGKVAHKVKPIILRWIVVIIGFVVGTIYLVRLFM